MSGITKKWGIVLLINLVLLPVLALIPALAQAEQVEASAEYEYGAEISFTGKFNSKIPIEKAHLFFSAGSASDTFSGEASMTDEGTFTYVHDLARDPIRAFSTIEYWFDLTLADGQTITGPKNSILYEDNRHEWEQRDRQPFRVHWYEGDTAFAGCSGCSRIKLEERPELSAIIPRFCGEYLRLLQCKGDEGSIVFIQ